MAELFSLFDLMPDIGPINVLAVGAMSLGPETEPYDAIVAAGHARVTGFEPDRAECEKLTSQYGLPHRFLPYFIGEGGPATYYQTNYTMTGSLLPPNDDLLGKFQNLLEITELQNTHVVETHRLDDIAEIGAVDFFKIDVQGAELAVFRGGVTLLSETMVVHTEVEMVEMYKGQPLFADIDGHLREAGFQFHTFVGVGSRCMKPFIVNDDKNKGLNQKLWFDAIYVRDFMQLEKLSTEKLRKYAAIMHDIYKSADLCHFILTELDRRLGENLADTYMNALMK